MRHEPSSTEPVGWAYWLGDHWHLCRDEPKGQGIRQPIYLATLVDYLRSRRDTVRREILRSRAEIRRKEARLTEVIGERNRLRDVLKWIAVAADESIADAPKSTIVSAALQALEEKT